MTLTQKFNLRNLPCFSFSIFSMNSCAFKAIGFTTFFLPLAKRPLMVKFNLVFFLNVWSSFLCIALLWRPFQRGAKLWRVSNLPKIFKTFFPFFFLSFNWCLLRSSFSSSFSYTILKNLTDLSACKHSTLTPQSFHWTRFSFSGCKGNRLFLISKQLPKLFQKLFITAYHTTP